MPAIPAMPAMSGMPPAMPRTAAAPPRASSAVSAFDSAMPLQPMSRTLPSNMSFSPEVSDCWTICLIIAANTGASARPCSGTSSSAAARKVFIAIAHAPPAAEYARRHAWAE